MQHLGEKTFLQEDQEHFATISGDVNPMHMDAVAARRLMVGRQVVHGVHVLLTAMEYAMRYQGIGRTGWNSIQCTFNSPVTVGDKVVFQAQNPADNELILEAFVGDLRCAHIVLNASTPNPSLSEREDLNIEAHDANLFQALSQPLENPQALVVGRRCAVPLRSVDWGQIYPSASEVWGPNVLASIASLSYVVGMICPGLHSIFSSIDISLDSGHRCNGLLCFSLSKYDPRFRLFEIGIDGPITGKIKAFMRPAPQLQPTTRDLMAEVVEHEFKGARALVVGGSRGLGEVTAKLLAAGGADVTVTYAAGAQDAQAVCDDINTTVGVARSRCQQLDVSCDAWATLQVDWDHLDCVYFYATPKIFKKKEGVFEGGLFGNFFDFYIRNFYEMCVFLEKTLKSRVRVYFPSTVFITDRPKGMTEYAMAKAAAEVLVQDINRSFKHVEVICTRLPRLNTDQNAAIVQEKSQSNVRALLPVIRAMQRRAIDDSVPAS